MHKKTINDYRRLKFPEVVVVVVLYRVVDFLSEMLLLPAHELT